MTMNPFEQSKQQLLHSLISQVEQEVIDYIRQEMQHDAPDSVPTEDELLTFFQSPDEATTLNAYQQMLATDKLCRCTRGQRSHLHRANLCPDAFRHQEERQPALYSQTNS